MQLDTEGKRSIPYYQRYENQPEFIDEKPSMFPFFSFSCIFFDNMRFEQTTPDDVKEDELLATHSPVPDYGSFYAPNIQKMYNRVQKVSENKREERTVCTKN